MRHLRIMVLTLVVGLTLAIGTQEAQAKSAWTGLVHALLAEGIQSHEVEWMTVNQLCIGYLGTPSHYNSCRFDKAITQVRHAQDRRVCKRKFGGAKYARLTITPRKHHPKFNTTLAEHHYHRKNHLRHNRLRNQRANLEQCMENRGWADSRRWR